MPVPDPPAYLDLIGRRCEQAASLLAGMTLEEFLNRHRRAGPRLPMEPRHRRSGQPADYQVPRLQAPETGRRSIIGSRNVMSHRLFARDWTELWHNLQDGIPVLREEVATLIAELG